MTLPVLGAAQGLTLFSTWLVVYREDADYFDRHFLAGQKDRSERAYRATLTLNHEATHFIQSYTTAFAYSYSVALLNLCSALMRDSREGHLTVEGLQEYRRIYHAHERQLTDKTNGVSALHLLEAAAVTEGYRATDTDVDGDGFAEHLDRFYPLDFSALYRTVVDRVSAEFGVDAALSLTPTLAFLALNTDEPAVWFSDAIVNLSSKSGRRMVSREPHEIASFLGFRWRDWIVFASSKLPVEARHPIVYPYFNRLLGLGLDEPDLLEFGALPGLWLRKGSHLAHGDVSELLPPLAIFSGGRGRRLGAGRHWSKEQTFEYLDTTGLVGACQRLLASERPYLSCPHADCSVHATAMCHAWYAVPHAIPWTDCAFPTRVSVNFGRSAADLFAVASATAWP